MSARPHAITLLTVVPFLGLALTGCGDSIQETELERQVAGALGSRFGVATEVSCPGDLDAEVGAVSECRALDPATGEEIPLRIRVTSVEGGTADFDIERVD